MDFATSMMCGSQTMFIADIVSSTAADLVEVELRVEGLECGKCSSRVHNALMVR